MRSERTIRQKAWRGLQPGMPSREARVLPHAAGVPQQPECTGLSLQMHRATRSPSRNITTVADSDAQRRPSPAGNGKRSAAVDGPVHGLVRRHLLLLWDARFTQAVEAMQNVFLGEVKLLHLISRNPQVETRVKRRDTSRRRTRLMLAAQLPVNLSKTY